MFLLFNDKNMLETVLEYEADATQLPDGYQQVTGDPPRPGQTAVLIAGQVEYVPEAPNHYYAWDGKTWILPPEKAAEMLADEKNRRLHDLNAQAQKIINDALGIDKVPDFEVSSWAAQAAEAKAWQADQSAPTPVLEGISAARGIPADTLKAAALRKALAAEQLTAHIAGQRQAFQGVIEAATTLEALEKIEIKFTLLR